MQLRIDHELCTGHGRCYGLAPDLFVDDDDGNGQVVGDGSVAPGQEDLARKAVANCPERAIVLVD